MTSTITSRTTRTTTTRISTTKKKLPPSWQSATHHRKYGTSRFCAVDGEGINLPDGEHRYVLLAVGQKQIENPAGLDCLQIFEFLYSQFKPGVAYVGYYLGYDFVQWLKSLPEDRAWALLSREGRARRRRIRKGVGVMPLPVEYAGWQMNAIPGKMLSIRPKVCKCRISLCVHSKNVPWMHICDAGPFFQAAFVKAIDPATWPEPIVSDAEYAEICEGKKHRASAELDDDMRRYNRLENAVLERLMKVLDEGLRSVGVNLPPGKWFGPGQAAQAWMHGRAPKRIQIEDEVPEWFRLIARAAYFGGWFEIFAHGIIPDTTWNYDINSAYVYFIANLPCLLHGKYTQGRGEPKAPGPFTLVRASLVANPGKGKQYIGTMLHRDSHGRIARPLRTEGHFWWFELQAAIKAGCISEIKYRYWYNYDACDCPPPLAEVAKLYELRLEVGKNTPLGRACRIIFNSIYGKLCQSIGTPVFANAIYASLITAGCRSMILDSIATHPKGKSDVVMVATDGVYFLSPHPDLPLSNKLGEWDETTHKNMCLFKPGVYWDDKARADLKAGEAPRFKARGVNAKDLGKKVAEIDAAFSEWNGKPPPGIHDEPFDHYDYTPARVSKNGRRWPAVTFIPEFQMVSALQAIMQKNWRLAGTTFSREVKQSSHPWRKRAKPYYDKKRRIYWSEPREYGDDNSWPDDCSSFPYDGRFGQEDPDNPHTDESRERFGITPDGYSFIDILNAISPEE